MYRVEGNFHMVQTCIFFADDPTTAKIKIRYLNIGKFLTFRLLRGWSLCLLVQH